jgi:hypothetical protein
LFKTDFHGKHLTKIKRIWEKISNQSKGGGIKIIDPRRIDYTYTDNTGVFDIKSFSDNGKYNDDSKKSKTEKDIHHLRYSPTKNTKMRTKRRITGGQSKQGHSSVYE